MTNIPPHKINDKPEEENFSLSYTVGIPCLLLEDPNLSDRQFRLMIHLIGLARKEGYCWASDKYLAEKMKVSLSQIKREVHCLYEKGYIEKNTTQEGMITRRAIYVAPAFSKKSYEGSPVTPRKGHPRPSGSSTGELPIYKATNIVKKKKRESPNFQSSDTPSPFSKFSKEIVYACVKLWEHVAALPVKSFDPRNSETTWFNWLDSMRKIMEIDKRSLSEVTEMIGYIHDDDFWDINVRSPQKLRQKWVEIELQKKKKLSHPSKEDLQEKNRVYAQEVVKTLRKNMIPKEVNLHANSSYLEIGSTNHPSSSIISFSEHGFKDQVESELRKMGYIHFLKKNN